VERLARYYNVPEADLTDEFCQFLLGGQADRIRAYHKFLGQRSFARMMGIPISNDIYPGKEFIVTVPPMDAQILTLI
jgi:hypothetical protein